MISSRTGFRSISGRSKNTSVRSKIVSVRAAAELVVLLASPALSMSIYHHSVHHNLTAFASSRREPQKRIIKRRVLLSCLRQLIFECIIHLSARLQICTEEAHLAVRLLTKPTGSVRRQWTATRKMFAKSLKNYKNA